MKKWIIRIAVAVVLLIVVAVAVVFFSLNSIVKKGVDTVGPKLTKVETRLKSANLSPFSGRGQLSGFFLGNPEGYKTPSAIQVGDIKVGVQVGSVFSDTVVVDEINVQAPEITFEGSLKGNNLSKILDNLNASSSSKPPAGKSSEKKFIVKDLRVEGGKVHLSATLLGGKALTVPLPDVHLQDIGSGTNGVTAAELSKKVMAAVVANATTAATEAMAKAGKDVQNIGKDLGKDALNQVDKAASGLKGLLK